MVLCVFWLIRFISVIFCVSFVCKVGGNCVRFMLLFLVSICWMMMVVFWWVVRCGVGNVVIDMRKFLNLFFWG